MVGAVIELGIADTPAEARSASYTDLAISGAFDRAPGPGKPTAWQLRDLGVVEICASLWGRALAGATVEPLAARRVLSADLLETVGRSLFIRGEFGGKVAVSGARLAIWPCDIVDVLGTEPSPLAWRYRLSIPTPESFTIETRPAGEVLHVRYGVEAHAPWHGVSPLTSASREIGSMASLMHRIGQQAAAPAGQLGVLPDFPDDADTKQVQQTLNALGGELRLLGGASGPPNIP